MKSQEQMADGCGGLCTASLKDVAVQCKFKQNFFHPNVYPSGTVCLSILNEVIKTRTSSTYHHVVGRGTAFLPFRALIYLAA